MRQITRILQTLDDIAGIICGSITIVVGYIGLSNIGIVGISTITSIVLIVIGIGTIATTTAKLVILSIHRE